MTALVQTFDAAADAFSPGAPAFADLPPPAPLDMPAQSLARAPAAVRAIASTATLRLGGMIAGTVALTGIALIPVGRLLAADTFGPLDAVILPLVALLFAWSAFSFLSALAGFIVGASRAASEIGLSAEGPTPPLTERTAVLLPIYNEAPAPVFARLRAIADSIEAAGERRAFDFFVLSDSTDAAVAMEEYAAFRRLKARMGWPPRLFYRRRPDNAGRKAGNIADWVRGFGAAYEHMVVLDADSLMEGETLVRLAAAMEQGPDIGLIQTAPAIINRRTLFSRAEQFASRLYGPMLAHGVAWWSGSEGNYWGHNAIIRTEAFAACAGLPRLSGRRPFGGDIMSHDFVEAALLRRAGWRVHLASHLGGSYEESPPTLAGLMARDRRWSQGNLQHLKVLCAKGLHWVSRFHLLRGVSAYLVSPLWLALVASATALALHPGWGVRAGAAHRLMARPSAFDREATAAVFAVSLGFLIAPKLFAYAQMLQRPGDRGGFGGARLAALNVAIETLLSTLVAPLIMLSHARSLAAAVAGRDSGWAAQTREAQRVPVRQAMKLHAPDTVMGLGLAAAAWATPIHTLVWAAPVAAGLILAAPLALATASSRLGLAAQRAGILLTPEERRPPQILARANAHAAGWPPS